MLMEAVAFGREQSPPNDVNFNSPGHRSSQDGSFIQDEADMHLILDFDGSRNTGHTNILTGEYSNSYYQPTSVLTSSWINRRQAKWATDFDANIAELDFDNVATRDILAIGAATGYECSDSYWKNKDMKDWNENRLRQSFKKSVLQASLDLSLSGSTSLFSSVGEDGNAATTERAVAHCPAFISTDSLDLSTLAVESEHIKTVCATRKRDYVLTYEQPGPMAESGLAESVQLDNYRDAYLSNACERTEADEVVASKRSQLLVDSGGLTTWGRIRRSYELCFGYEENNCTGKSVSLPNLSVHQQQNYCSGAGERMTSGCDNITLPIYNAAQSMSGSSHYHSCLPPEERLSLLKVYRNKLSLMGGVVDNLTLPTANPMDDSSGYATGGNGAATDDAQKGAKPKKVKSKKGKLDEEEEKEELSSGQRIEDNQIPGYRPNLVRVNDYEYAEFFVNGRYIDINHNEIGYVPHCTQGLQKVPASTSSSVQVTADIPRNQRAQFCLNNSVESAGNNDRWAVLTSPRVTRIAPAKPPRTFATLLENSFNKQHGQSVGCRSTRLKDSGTQLPVYVADQSVQTSCWDSGKLVKTVVTTSVHWSPPEKPVYSSPCQIPAMNCSKNAKTFGFQPSSRWMNSGLMDDGGLPDLSFLKMPFDVPPLFPSAMPFPLAFLTASSPHVSANREEVEKQLNFTSNQPATADTGSKTKLDLKGPSASPIDRFLLGCNTTFGKEKFGLPSPPWNRVAGQKVETSFYDNENEAGCSAGVTRDRDSGLGSSGPSHIQDWESLATLLPKNVVQTCSFFKANSQLLSQSQQGNIRDCLASNSIDKPRRSATSGRCVRAGRSRCQGNRPMSEPAFNRFYDRVARFESIREEDLEPECRETSYKSARQTAVSCGCFHCPSHCAMLEEGGVACREYNSCPTMRNSTHHYHHHCHHYHHQCCHKKFSNADTRRNNLQKWNVRRLNCRKCDEWGSLTGSESEDSEAECSCVPSRPGRAYSVGSSTDEEECFSDSYYLPGAMTSEYQLRSRNYGTGEPSRFLSLQNVRDYQRQRGSFLSVEKSERLGRMTSSTACATCFRVRSPSGTRPPVWAFAAADAKTKEVFCDCQTSDILEEMEEEKRRKTAAKRHLVHFFRDISSSQLSDEEMALQNTELYHCKKEMVMSVVEACDIVVSVFSSARKSTSYKVENVRRAVSEVIRNSLCPAFEKVLADGLLGGCSIWGVIQASATLGPATRSIHELVTDLNHASGQISGEHSLRFLAFINGLLSLRSLDCWLSYLVLKDRVLSDHYDDTAFLRRAATAYRSLFTQLLIGIQPLSLMHFDHLRHVSFAIREFIAESPRRGKQKTSALRSSSVPAVTSRISLEPELNVTFRTPEHSVNREKQQYALLPTKLPSDSRVPKSSSVPSRLCSPNTSSKSKSVDSGMVKLVGKTPSRIPVLMKTSPSFPGAGKKTENTRTHRVANGQEESAMSISDTDEQTEARETSNNNKRMVIIVEDCSRERGPGLLSCAVGEKLELTEPLSSDSRLLRCRRKVPGGHQEGFVQREKISFLRCL